MYVQLTFCKFNPGSIDEAKRIYREDIVPAVSQQKGNLGILLLEPVDKADDFVAVIRWRTMADANAFEHTGLYESLTGELVGHYVKEPVVRSYESEDAVVPAS